MPAVRPDAVLRFIRKLAVREQFDRLSDSKLLDRFVSTRDQEAFAALVRRHGPMVLRVCLQVLDNGHDAEDAFQATFLVLSRKAASVKKRQSVGSWLFGVANHAALDLKRRRARLRSRESRAGQRSVTDPLTTLTLQEAQTILNQELARLPEKYRAPLVLCSLEGLTRDEAAQQLGLPVGTLKSRLEQARQRLRLRLTARGLSLSAAFVASVFGEQMASAAIPTALLTSTVQAATAVAAGSAAASLISAQVAALTEGVLKAMFVNKLKIAAILLLAGGLIAGSSGALTLGRFTAGTLARSQADAEPASSSASADAPRKPTANAEQPKPSWKKAARFQVGSAAVLSVAFAPDGNYMVAGCDDGNVRVWGVPSGEELGTLRGENSEVSCVAFSPINRNLLATGVRKFKERGDRGDGEVKLWHLRTATEKAAFKGLVPPIYGLAFDPGGRVLAAADTNAVKLWDVSSNNEKLTFQLKEKTTFQLKGMQMNSVAFSPEGRTLAAAGFQHASHTPGVVKLWDVQSGNEVATLRDELGGSVYAVAFSPDGRTLAVTSMLDVILWDVTKEKPKKKASFRVLQESRPSRPIYSLAFSPDGKTLAVGWEQVKLLDAATLEERATLEVKVSGSTRVAFAPDGKRLAVAGYLRGEGGGGFVQWWILGSHAGPQTNTRANSDVTKKTTQTAEKPKEDTALMQGTWKVVSAVFDGQADNDLKDAKLIFDGGKFHLIVTDEEKFKLRPASSNFGVHVGIFQLDPGKKPKEIDFLQLGNGLGNGPFAQGTIFFGIYALDGDNLKVCVNRHGKERPSGFNAKAGSRLTLVNLKRDQQGPPAVAAEAASDPKQANDGPVFRPEQNRDLTKGNDPVKFLRVSGQVKSLAWSPDSARLAVLAETGRDMNDRKDAIRLWDARAGRQLRILSETMPILSATFSPDGKTVAGVFWKPDERREGCAFSEVRLFDQTTGKEVATLAGAPPEGLGVEFMSTLLTTAYSPDGKLVAGGGKLVSVATRTGAAGGLHIGGEVCVWDVATRKMKWHNRTTHTNIVYAVAFAPDGRTLASGGLDNLIRLWDPQTGELKKTLFGVTWGGVSSLAFSPDSTVLASGGNMNEEGGKVRLWDVKTGCLIRTITDFREFPVGIAFSRDGKTLFASGVKDAKPPTWQVRQWEVATGKSQGVLAEGKGAGGVISASPDGRRLAIGTSDGEVLFRDLTR